MAAAPSGARAAAAAPARGANLWQQLLRDSSVRSKLPVVNLLVVGDHESGKSALLARLDERGGARPADAKDDAASATAASATGAAGATGETATATATGANAFASSSLLSFATMHVLDRQADDDDVIAHINTWTLNELPLAALVETAVKPAALAHTAVAVVLDLSRPWTIKGALEQWTSTLEGHLLAQINKLPVEQRGQLYSAVKQHILEYEDPSVDHSVPTSMELSNKKEFLEEGALAKNLGVPLVFVVAKSDLRTENSVKMDYVEYFLRQFAIKYGAAVVYTSAKIGTNVDLLRQYVLHRVFPAQFKFDHAPQLVERGAIFVPAGYDSFGLVHQSLVGSQPKWPADKPFEKIVPVPAEEAEDHAGSSTSAPGTPNGGGDVKLDAHERWLEKLEKAAGAGLEELQKQSVEASKKAEAAAAARRAAAERRKREEKDVSSTHLANFFNNLLSRPEKSKSGRSLDVKKKEKSEPNVKSLAEQELQNLKRSNGP